MQNLLIESLSSTWKWTKERKWVIHKFYDSWDCSACKFADLYFFAPSRWYWCTCFALWAVWVISGWDWCCFDRLLTSHRQCCNWFRWFQGRCGMSWLMTFCAIFTTTFRRFVFLLLTCIVQSFTHAELKSFSIVTKMAGTRLHARLCLKIVG